MEAPKQPNIDLKSTEGMKNAEGGSIFKSGVILRKISKFVAGTDNDAIMPIPIFYDPNTNKWWIDALDDYPSSGIMTRTWYDTKAEADAYYNSIIND